ncbi:hypothetical protein [Sulfitobacter donghicola]|uniref:Uncharacterized protein n=1 Tax=Sulfitobacter donghicola DSW-25 = KCTC 12864 = JCM 14565 TaxID=1300350 RepID=A0A073IL87_9RHOB|nr:hypothetical protein [Sulfitobacter donghicola]KEJ91063.1 hypothetical protein DSW25_02125 [Sulfitobacter donghicola DSW-25 = KCTC 12864 = JCM 14565]KIN67990.1 Acyl-CoA dehydrogenase [Sulfitobacter donghicola DSW-25 = KCTC 12864 = JCM 14565]
MKIFAQTLSSLLPSGITLAPELVETFDWLEDQGWHHINDTGTPADHWLAVHPTEMLGHPVASYLAFGGTDLGYTGHWSVPDPAIDNRIAQIGETSGDGGRLAIWLDEVGKQHFVHIGHDSLGLITDDPLILLQFLAMGYPEVGSLQNTNVTPIQATLDHHGATSLDDFGPDDQPVMPTALQGFLKQRFGLDMPRTARDLGIANFPEYSDTETNDPFAKWIASVTPQPTEADLAYELELMRTVEALNINDDDSSDAIMDKIGTLFAPKN